MQPNQLFKDKNAAYLDSYSCAELRLITDTASKPSNFYRAVLRFLKKNTEFKPHETTLADYGDVKVLKRIMVNLDAIGLLDAIMHNVPVTLHTQAPPLKFRQSANNRSQVREDWPIPFGQYRRTDAYPEYVFSWESDINQRSFRFPILKPNLTPLLHEHDLTFFLNTDAPLIEPPRPELLVVLPDYRAGITAVKLKAGTLQVTVQEGTLSIKSLRLRIAYREDNWTKEQHGEPTSTGFQQTINDSIPEFYLFLTSLDGDLIDWTTLKPGAAEQPQGFDIEFPESTLKELINEGENQTTEFKTATHPKSRDDFMETVSAFSNTQGGRILVGVNDDQEIVGLEKIEDHRQRIEGWCLSQIEPKPDFAIRSIQAEGRDLLIVEVAKGDQPPYQHKGRHQQYARHGEHDLPMTRGELETIYTERQAGSRRSTRRQ